MISRSTGLILFLLATVVCARAQEKDAGLWMGVKSEVDFGKNWSAHIDPEIRLDENISKMNKILADVGIEKKVHPLFSVETEYRLEQKNKKNRMDMGQRFSLGGSVKKRIGEWSGSLTAKWQLTSRMQGINRDPSWKEKQRMKGTIKYHGIKKWNLATSFEVFHEETEFLLSDWRWQANVERKVGKKKHITAGYLIQKEIQSQETEFIFLVGYKFEWITTKSFEKPAD